MPSSSNASAAVSGTRMRMTLADVPHDSRIRPRRAASATMRCVYSASGRVTSPSRHSSIATIAPSPRTSQIAGVERAS